MPSPLLLHLFTVPESLPFIDGQPAFLRGRGYDVRAISAGGESATAFAEQQGIEHHAIPFTRRVTPIRDSYCLLKTYRLFRRLRPDIVHGNTPKAGLLGMLAAWLNRTPVRVYELHGFPFESRRGLSRTCLLLLEKLTCRLATQVLAVSASVRAVALTEGIVSTAKITVLHHGSCNGVEAADRFNSTRLDQQKLMDLKASLGLSNRVIGFVGRITRDKGIYELLEAWSIIRSAYPDVCLLLAGNAEADFSAHPILHGDTRIRVAGHVTDMPYYYALMDFLVLPTYREGFGNVLIEAAAMERPAVVSRVTGTVDAVIDGQTGLFCDVYSVDSLVRQLRVYLDHPAIVRAHGQNARQRVLQDFVPSDIWAAKRQLYDRLLAKAGRPSPENTAP